MFRLKLSRNIIQLLLVFFYLILNRPGNFLLIPAAGCLLYTVFIFIQKKRRAVGLLSSIGSEAADSLFICLMLILSDPLWIIPVLGTRLLELHRSPENRYRKFHTVILSGSAMAGSFRTFFLYGELSSLIILLSFLFMLFLAIAFFNSADLEEKKEKAYLERLLESKNKLLSTLTHELRTPLAVIKTSTEILLEERSGPVNDTQRKFLDSSLENTHRLTQLVENILAHVKVEYAWFRMDRRRLDIRPLIRKVYQDILPYLESRNLKLRYNYPGLLSKTLADGKWIQQVLINLIHNSAKHMDPGGVIDVSVKENEQCIVVSVADTGSGIKYKDIPSIFDEYFQGDTPMDPQSDGAGLGLTIVKDIIERHGGKVYASSLPNSGTTVSFTLPVSKGGSNEA